MEELLRAVEDALEQWDQCDDALAMTVDFQEAMTNLRKRYELVTTGEISV